MSECRTCGHPPAWHEWIQEPGRTNCGGPACECEGYEDRPPVSEIYGIAPDFAEAHPHAEPSAEQIRKDAESAFSDWPHGGLMFKSAFIAGYLAAKGITE